MAHSVDDLKKQYYSKVYIFKLCKPLSWSIFNEIRSILPISLRLYICVYHCTLKFIYRLYCTCDITRYTWLYKVVLEWFRVICLALNHQVRQLKWAHLAHTISTVISHSVDLF